MNELVLPQSIQLPSSTIKHRREIYKICEFLFSVIKNKSERILWVKGSGWGGGGVGFANVSCQLSF